MIDEFVVEYLSLSDKMRNGYEDSLGIANQAWNETFNKIVSTVPDVFRAIYGKVAGTYRNTAHQKFMDFVPGYRLIHIEETIFHYSPGEGLQKMHNSVELFFKTIIAFYLENVFYLDRDGFLDYDFEREGIIGAEYNPGIDYWTK